MDVPPPATFNSTSKFNVEYIGGEIFFRDLNNPKKVAESFKTCPPLSYILTQKALLHNNGIIKCVDPKTKKELPQKAKDFERLLKYPNPLQTQHQFRAQVTTIVQLYGFCPVLRIKEEVFNSVTQLWILPPQYLTIKRNKRYLFTTDVREMIDEIIFDYEGERTRLSKEDVYFFTDLTTSVDDIFKPDARIEAQSQIIANLIANYEARGEMLINHGARGILSNMAKDNIGTIPLGPNAKDELHADWRRYGIKKGQRQIIITNASLQWQQIGMPFGELMLLEQSKDDIMSLCAALNFKFQLIPFGTETAFNNQDKAYKAQYEDGTIPEANNYITQFNEITESESNGVLYIIDYSHISYLQVDKKAASEVLRNNYQSAFHSFIMCLCNYTDAVKLVGISEPTNQWKDKWFYELDDTDKEYFKTLSNVNNNQNNGQGNQGNQSNSGNNNQN